MINYSMTSAVFMTAILRSSFDLYIWLPDPLLIETGVFILHTRYLGVYARACYGAVANTSLRTAHVSSKCPSIHSVLPTPEGP